MSKSGYKNDSEEFYEDEDKRGLKECIPDQKQKKKIQKAFLKNRELRNQSEFDKEYQLNVDPWVLLAAALSRIWNPKILFHIWLKS
jgi:hypothetical protein